MFYTFHNEQKRLTNVGWNFNLKAAMVHFRPYLGRFMVLWLLAAAFNTGGNIVFTAWAIKRIVLFFFNDSLLWLVWRVVFFFNQMFSELEVYCFMTFKLLIRIIIIVSVLLSYYSSSHTDTTPNWKFVNYWQSITRTWYEKIGSF